MLGAIGVPTNKAPLNVATFVSYILPPLLLYFVMAILAITPHTPLLRMACWLVLVSLAWRATFSVDMALGTFERKFNNDLLNPMLMIVTRSIYWAFAKDPLVRHLRPLNSTPSTFMDALDLALAFRGHGWDWSHGLYIPRETRPSNRIRFVFHVALSALVHAFICGTSHRALRSFSPVGLGSISGGSIFDETLPLHVRYLRSSIISIIGALACYSLLQMSYDLCTLVGVLFLGQDPAQWPPGFDAPWRSTSIAQFWGRRWHQWLRHIFLVQGGYPLSFLFGRVGFVTGAFLSSAVYHHAGFSSLDSTSELWRMVLGFGMMAPAIFAEQTFKRWTGKKVCGMAGWVWTMTWLVLWGNVLVDGFARAGIFRADALIDGVPPLRTLVERLAMDLDAWFHAV
ncbi:hypothetical protein L210DRAFT_3390662 [Boletus edulis BED1]|uniref:Wax synthase domain-containing protein n=1 Tax=Boletus edulis BED1 TaxID=1328754 RepID=A0AAD4C2W5_BOLED|nr:hypothetical protein L210DRAFT_3390662 [Boletus edulis BED1]